MRAKQLTGAALTADVVGSRTMEGFASRWPRILARLSQRHLKRGWIEQPYQTTAWDEFQNLTTNVVSLPRMLLDMRRFLAPVAVRVGIGIGRIDRTGARRPINESAGGPAFESAREALNELRDTTEKYPRLTGIRTGDVELDRLLRMIWDLNDTLLLRVTPRQWVTVQSVLSSPTRTQAARALGIRESTITRNLQRAFYWQTERCAAEMEAILTNYHAGTASPAPQLHAGVQKRRIVR